MNLPDNSLSFESYFSHTCMELIKQGIFVLLAYFLVLFVFKKSLCCRKIQKEQFDSRIAFSHELRWFFLSMLFPAGPLSLLVTLEINSGYVSKDSINFFSAILELLVFMISYDFYLYISHRFMHLPLPYRYIHYIHHKSKSPQPLTSYSFHPFEILINGFFLVGYIYFFGIHFYVLIVIALLSLHTIVSHLGFEINPRWWCSSKFTQWIVTPTYHHLHHSHRQNYNFGAYTTIWDFLFGTLNPVYVAKFNSVTCVSTSDADKLIESTMD